MLERLQRLSWQEFEDFMAEAYRRRGYHVEQRARGLAAAMHKVGATGGVFVTTGDFTKPARQFATALPIELADGEALIKLLSARKAA